MRSNVLKIVFAAAFCGLSVSCVATQGDVSGVYARQTRLEAKMERLTKEVNSMKTGGSGSAGSVALQEKVYKLESRVDELSQQNSRLQARMNSLTMGSSGSITEGESVTTTEFSTGTVVDTEEIIYNQAYTQLGAGNYKESREQFKMFISKYPDSSKTGDAVYWTAETYYRDGDFEESVLEYQKFIDEYPKDDKVPTAYLKQGMALVENGQGQDAELFFQALIDKYPSSDEAKSAKEKLRNLQ